MTVFVDILWAVFPLCLWRLLLTFCKQPHQRSRKTVYRTLTAIVISITETLLTECQQKPWDTPNYCIGHRESQPVWTKINNSMILLNPNKYPFMTTVLWAVIQLSVWRLLLAFCEQYFWSFDQLALSIKHKNITNIFAGDDRSAWT
jgi:hypothetical protein